MHGEATAWRHPYSEEDPSDDLADLMQDERRAMLMLFSSMLDEMPECPEKYGVAYAIGATFLAGRSMSEIAAKLGTTRALISHRARDFCRRHQIPPSPYMRAMTD
jgi:hypothetical protein